MLSLGTVTSVLLVGIIFGILMPEVVISSTIKDFFFLLFLFAIGYSVGPQFFRSFKSTGLPQVIFAVLMCAICLGVTLLCAKIAGYNAGEAAGLFSGAQTISAVIGVGQETIAGLNIPETLKTDMSNSVPVIYAVCYVFGTAGSAWIIAFLCPYFLGGMKKCRDDCKAQEEEMGETLISQPGYSDARRQVAFRCYKIDNEWFENGKSIDEIEKHLSQDDRRIFVDRLRQKGQIIDTPSANTLVYNGDEIVISGRREYIVGEERCIGNEFIDPELLTFAVKQVRVVLHNKGLENKPIKDLLQSDFMHGVSIQQIKRNDNYTLPIRANVQIQQGDTITLVGMPNHVDQAAKKIGFAEVQTSATDIIFMALGILIGGIIGVLTINAGNIPISLTTSGGALVMGLICGWWHSKRPNYGQMPDAADWIFRDLGLNVFIAVVGISCGPHFIEGFQKVGWMVFIWGAVATSVPLIIGALMARYIFKMRPGTALGCIAGARTTTAALGAIEETMHSSVPAMGYAITYAVGNTAMILMGVAMVLLCA